MKQDELTRGQNSKGPMKQGPVEKGQNGSGLSGIRPNWLRTNWEDPGTCMACAENNCAEIILNKQRCLLRGCRFLSNKEVMEKLGSVTDFFL